MLNRSKQFLAVAVVGGALLALPQAASGAAVVRSASGANVPAIQSTVDQYRVDLGGVLNPNNGQSFATGRREINWDGVPDGSSAPNPLSPQFFNVNSSRGVVFSTPGTGFLTSATVAAAGAGGQEFGNIDGAYDNKFNTFSAQRLFTPIGSTVTDVEFRIPGTNRLATTRGFGAVFTDVDSATSSKIEYFDVNGVSLGSFNVPNVAASEETLSFLGVTFNAGERVARVRITSGVTNIAVGSTGEDVVVLDDFLYAEPAPQFTNLTVAQTGASSVAAGGQVTYTATVTNNGPDPVDDVALESQLSGIGGFASASAGCGEAAGTVTCSLGRLANGASANVEIVVTAPQDSGEMTSAVSVTSAATDTSPGDDDTVSRTTVTSPPPDSKSPNVSVEGVPQKLKLKQFVKKGVTVAVDADEASSFEIALLGSAKKLTLGRKSFDVTLAKTSLLLSNAERTVQLKPRKKLVKKAKKLTARVQVVGSDAAGNKTTQTSDIRVKK